MISRLKQASSLLVFTALVALFGCGGNSTSPYSNNTTTPTTTKSSPNTVVIASMAFSPANLTVTKGTVVTWQNNDNVGHTSTSDNGVWDTGNIPSGGNTTTTFSTAGTFTYHCTVHPMMTGTITVQ